MKEKLLSRQFSLVAACFLISGFAALLYETVWLRQFAILLGTSEQALAVVLASYMGGLAVGALVASRWVNAIRRPLLTYGVLECGIALTALFVPIGISLAAGVQTMILGGNAGPAEAGGWAQVGFCFATAFALILLPTGLMGATLPMLARHVVTRDEELGQKIGLLYAINTAGAVMGTMIAAFYLLPSLGLGTTTWIGVAANLLVFLVVLAMVRGRGDIQAPIASIDAISPVAAESDRAGGTTARRKKKTRRRNAQADSATDATGRKAVTAEPRYRLILVFAAISGAVSFCYEIVFTRMLGHMLGGSVFAFATMLAGFLLGIAIGGGLAGRVASNRRTSAVAFVYAQSLAAICTLMTYHVVNQLVAWPWERIAGESTTMVQVIASIVALLPTSICIGATFPLAIRIYARDEREAALGSARVYCWNVVGGIAGAMATGMVILPALHYQGATALAVVLNLLIAAGVIFVLKVRTWHIAMIIVAALVFVRAFPTMPENVLRVSALSGRLCEGRIIFNHAGRSATVTVFDDYRGIQFRTNGLPEALVFPKGNGEIHQSDSKWLSALPSMVRPECRSMLIVGLGGGVAAESVPPSIESIDVMELEPAVVAANRHVSDLRDHDPLSDPRVQIIINDARNSLALSDKKYDVIVSQPSHPWTAGASHLYTHEFDRMVRDHLNPGGIFLQWMNTEFVDVELTRSIGATLLNVFPHTRLYEPTLGSLMFVASDRPLRPESLASRAGDQILANVNPSDRSYFQRLGVVSPTHLFARLSLDEQGLRQVCKGAELISDERNLLAMRAPFLAKDEDDRTVEMYLADYAPLTRGLDAAKSLCPQLELPTFVALRLTLEGPDWGRRVGLPLIDDPARRAMTEARMRRGSEPPEQWLAGLRDGAKRFPDSSDFACQLLSNHLFGKVNLTDEEQSRMREALSPRHALIIELIEDLVAGELASAEERDADLAQCPVDDSMYETAVLLRLPWRLEAPSSERLKRCNEAIEIIDQSAPFTNAVGLSFFRASAGIKANRPEVAVATAGNLAQTILESIADPQQSPNPAAISNLIRCYEILGLAGNFRGIREVRYREVLEAVQSALAAAQTR